MLKTRELVGIIEDALIEMDGCVSKPDENGYVTRISANVKVEGHNIYLEYEEDGYVDKYKIEVHKIEPYQEFLEMKLSEILKIAYTEDMKRVLRSAIEQLGDITYKEFYQEGKLWEMDMFDKCV